MTAIPKHEPTKKTKGGKKTRLTQPDMPESSAAFVDVTRVADAIDGLRSVISTWVTQERNGDNGSGLFSGIDTNPVRVRLVSEDNCDVFDGIVGALEDQHTALERMAKAFERIADAMTASKSEDVAEAS
jgi:hypothetical protein